jgi:hypothetical protein
VVLPVSYFSRESYKTPSRLVMPVFITAWIRMEGWFKTLNPFTPKIKMFSELAENLGRLTQKIIKNMSY